MLNDSLIMVTRTRFERFEKKGKHEFWLVSRIKTDQKMEKDYTQKWYFLTLFFPVSRGTGAIYTSPDGTFFAY